MFGGVMPLPEAIAVAAGRQARSVRSFRTNSGTTDYVQLAQPVVLAGDFSVEWTMAASSAGTRIFGTSAAEDGRFYARLADGSDSAIQVGLLIGSTNSGLITPPGFVEPGKLSTISVSRIGSTVTVGNMSTGAEYTGGIGTEPAVIDAFCRHLTNFCNGALSDVRITSNGTLIHHWPMNEGTGSTHYDTVGGNHATIINGASADADWERFEKLPNQNYWLGKELVNTNAGFDGVDFWTAQARWLISGGVASYDYRRAESGNDLSRWVLSGGRSYLIGMDIVDISSGSISVWNGSGGVLVGSVAGRYATKITTSPTFNQLLIYSYSAASTIASIDNVSARRMLEVAA